MELAILAAGKSSRFKKDGISHKCLVKINGKTLIGKIISDFRNENISKINVITGHNKKELVNSINDRRLKFIHNRFYASRDMLYSFYLSILNQKEDMILSYSDILYSKKIIKNIKKIKKKKRIILPVLMNWEKIWQSRKKDIFEDCETLRFDKKLNLLEIGNRIKNKKEIMAQYMGIIFIPFVLKNILIEEIKKEKNNRLHITNFLNQFLKKYKNIDIIKTNDLWYEFDDVIDYESFIKRS
jgi:L-glutamine-phosphate cytidylyltransferase